MAEGVTSNLFWIKNDILYTPSLETGILPGIIRAWVLDKASALNLDVREGFIQKRIYYKVRNASLPIQYKRLCLFGAWRTSDF